MNRLQSLAGNTAAWLTVAVAVLGPFLLFGAFQKIIGSAGLKIHQTFSGGEVVRTVDRPKYRIEIFEPVSKTAPLQRVDPFIQIRWTPAAALPAIVSDAIDIDGDGTPDVRIQFRPADLELHAAPLHTGYHDVYTKGIVSFSNLIARVDDSIVVRFPLQR